MVRKLVGRSARFRARAKMGTRAFAVFALGAALTLTGCADDDLPRHDGGVSVPPPTGVDTGTPAPAATDAGTADSSSPVVVPPTDSGPGVTPLDGGVAETGVEPEDPDADTDLPDGAIPTEDAGVTPPWALRDDLGKGDGSDVVTIGDSWMSGAIGGAGIQAGLDRQMTNYRHYAATATTLTSGQIPGQYDRAKRANPKISTVIMTGGGNDVMFQGNCSTQASCQAITDKITDALNTLWTKMAEDGVKDVVYILYADVAGSADPKLRGMGKPVPVCMSGKIICHVLPTTPIVTKASDLTDGIHPNSAANTRIAKATIALMEMRKIRR